MSNEMPNPSSGLEEVEERLKKARNRRNGGSRLPFIAGGAAVLLAALLLIPKGGGKAPAESQPAQAAETQAVEPTLSPEEQAREAREQAIDEEIASYGTLGIVQVDGYLNMHDGPAQKDDIIGKLYDGSACEILGEEDGWLHVTSGGISGFIHPDYVLQGEGAEIAAREEIRDRAEVTAEKLFVRAAPSTDAEILGSVLKNERYVVFEEKDGWYRMDEGWISGEYATVRPCLNVARRLDLRAMVLNMYNELGISMVDNYLNIRKEPSEEGEIIGKLTRKAGCDILEVQGDWLKIHSGDVTGYVKAEYIATGEQARQEAVEIAELMAIVNTDVLNARAEPKEDSPIWTQISNSQRYPVLEQLDGWVRIELEEDESAYVKTDFVDVRYALNEAIHFSPAEEAAMKSASLRQQIVNYALQFLGNPYVWGGTSLTRGCDCSGFTMKILENFGVSLPHYSGSQAQMGSKVTSDSMRPGDLIFYSNSRGTINHVAMYIGNGQIVHAASRRSGIKISSWNYRTPRAIRNMLGD